LTVTVTNRCKDNLITPILINDVLYQIGSLEERMIVIGLWKQSMSGCGEITYKIKVDDLQGLP